MKLDELKLLLSKLKKIDLKAWEAHKMLVPVNRNYKITNTGSYKNASVLALLFPLNGEVYLALIKRATYNGKHSGQIALPGGKQEKEDATHWHTAIRETEEEIGVSASEIEYIKTLSSVQVTVSNYIVHPFLGKVNYTPQFILQEEEVAGLLKVPFSVFLKSEIEKVSINLDPSNKIIVPAFTYNEYVIWGATAMMLNELKILFIECMDL